jgi:hypothetical protein
MDNEQIIIPVLVRIIPKSCFEQGKSWNLSLFQVQSFQHEQIVLQNVHHWFKWLFQVQSLE